MHQVELTLPVISTTATPKPPENIPPEAYEAMNTEVALFGSPEVGNAMNEFALALQPFRAAVWAFQTMREQGTSAQMTGSFEEMAKARQVARDAFEALTSTIRDELYGL